jgi:hypothetical protein
MRIELATMPMDWKDPRGRWWVVDFDVRLDDGGEEYYAGVRLTSAEGVSLTPAVLKAFTNSIGDLKERDIRIRQEFYAERNESPRSGLRGTKPGPERKYPLEEVARVYKRAKAQGKPTGRAVQARFKVSASYASRLVKQARREGHIDEGSK